MMRWLWHVIGIGLVAVWMIAIGPIVFGSVPFPNLYLAIVVLLALRRRPALSFLWAAVGGSLLDLTVVGPGIYLLSLLVVAGISSLVAYQLESRVPITLLVPVALIASFLLPTWELWASGSGWHPLWIAAGLMNLLGIAVVGLVMSAVRRLT